MYTNVHTRTKKIFVNTDIKRNKKNWIKNHIPIKTIFTVKARRREYPNHYSSPEGDVEVGNTCSAQIHEIKT